jgi:hypothetical protein
MLYGSILIMTESSVFIAHGIRDDLLKLEKIVNKESLFLDFDELAEPFPQKYVQGMLQEKVDNYMMELRLAINAGLAEIVSCGEIFEGAYTMKGIPQEGLAEYS